MLRGAPLDGPAIWGSSATPVRGGLGGPSWDWVAAWRGLSLPCARRAPIPPLTLAAAGRGWLATDLFLYVEALRRSPVASVGNRAAANRLSREVVSLRGPHQLYLAGYRRVRGVPAPFIAPPPFRQPRSSSWEGSTSVCVWGYTALKPLWRA